MNNAGPKRAKQTQDITPSQFLYPFSHLPAAILHQTPTGNTYGSVQQFSQPSGLITQGYGAPAV